MCIGCAYASAVRCCGAVQVRYDNSDVFFYGSQALVPLGREAAAAQGLSPAALPADAVEYRTSLYNSMRFVAHNASRAEGPTKWIA